MVSEEFLDKMPETIKTIIRLTDLNTAFVLVENYGGRNLHFPRSRMVNDRHELAYLIGFNNLSQLCRYFDGDTIYIPYARDYAQYLRYEKISQDSEKLSSSELAKKYQMSVRWINVIKHRYRNRDTKVKKDDRQLDMFES